MTALIWILLAVALVAVVYAAYLRNACNNWKTRAEIAEAAGMVNLRFEADRCAGCMHAIKNAALLRQRATALALMKGGDFYAAQNILEGGTEE